MRRWSIAAVCVLGAVLLAGATQAEIEIGVLAGWSVTDWDYEVPGVGTGDIFEGKNGFQAGLFAAVPMGEYFGLRAEALYVRKGASFIVSEVDNVGQVLGDYELFHNVSYLQIPLLLTVFVGEGEIIRPVVFAGPYLAFEFDANLKVEPVGNSDPDREIEEVFGETESTDFGFVLGGGFELRSGDQVIHFQARYDLGLPKVYLDAKNEAWTIMAGIGF